MRGKRGQGVRRKHGFSMRLAGGPDGDEAVKQCRLVKKLAEASLFNQKAEFSKETSLPLVYQWLR